MMVGRSVAVALGTATAAFLRSRDAPRWISIAVAASLVRVAVEEALALAAEEFVAAVCVDVPIRATHRAGRQHSRHG